MNEEKKFNVKSISIETISPGQKQVKFDLHCVCNIEDFIYIYKEFIKK